MKISSKGKAPWQGAMTCQVCSSNFTLENEDADYIEVQEYNYRTWLADVICPVCRQVAKKISWSVDRAQVM